MGECSAIIRASNTFTATFDGVASRFLAAWEDEAGLETYGEAVAEVLDFRASEGEPLEMSPDDWRRHPDACRVLPGKGFTNAFCDDAPRH